MGGGGQGGLHKAKAVPTSSRKTKAVPSLSLTLRVLHVASARLGIVVCTSLCTTSLCPTLFRRCSADFCSTDLGMNSGTPNYNKA